MMEPRFPDETEPVETLTEPRDLVLVVMSRGPGVVHRLPTSGSVVIGRSEQADIRISDSSISRRHAELFLTQPLTIRDLGSANGVWLRNRRLALSEVAALTPGEPIELGAVVVVAHRPSMLPHGAPAPPDPALPQDPKQPLVCDEAMLHVHALVDRVARSDLSVLLLGETGVGKEVIAAALHRGSLRAGGPFLKLNCAAISENLLESELFGYERGAFTGADRAKMGLLEAANGGAVFLDEVGELSLDMQAKLLRTLEERVVRRVGGLSSHPIDVRFIAATNRNLALDVERGAFRSDLYYRLNGMTIRIPPLRERRAEIQPLAQRFFAQARARMGLSSACNIDDEVVSLFLEHTWPGNIRELRNAIERAVVLSGGAGLRVEDLPPELTAERSRSTPEAPPLTPLSSAAEEQERCRILETLEQCAGNQTRAAKHLGISRRTLINRLDAYGIPRPRKKNPRR